MTRFRRKFPIERINDRVLETNRWFTDMLATWRPAGDALVRDMTKTKELVSPEAKEEDPKRLRLTIRNGYLNFYRGGQSISKVGFNKSGELQALIHNKYVYPDGGDQHYVTLTSTGVRDRKKKQFEVCCGVAQLPTWIERANKHVHSEKRFVDQVVARNPNTIDLEIGLPVSPDATERTAPRMDLAALEPTSEGWRIVFWEAKPVKSGDARCSGQGMPKVVRQLANYENWLRCDKKREDVVLAYGEACRLLVELHALAKQFNPAIEDLGPGIRAATAPGAPPLQVAEKPRLLIDDRSKNAAFTNNGHLDKLRQAGLHVQMVRSPDQMKLEVLR